MTFLFSICAFTAVFVGSGTLFRIAEYITEYGASFALATLGHTIAPGQPACLFLADVKSLSDLVYASHGDSVVLTMVDGKVVYMEGLGVPVQ